VGFKTTGMAGRWWVKQAAIHGFPFQQLLFATFFNQTFVASPEALAVLLEE
jgi:hypothetical protein